MLTRELQETLSRAVAEAVERRHEYLTLEHDPEIMKKRVKVMKRAAEVYQEIRGR